MDICHLLLELPRQVARVQLSYHQLISNSPCAAASVRPVWQLGIAMKGADDTNMNDRNECEKKMTGMSVKKNTRTHFT